ncbi:ComEC family competence protein [Rhizobium sp. TRM95111]|uniref:ComEC/Rec2 family competence protein n=1 Tax=Rhizobium alarense TaxID=2846851 RepID=UPI001F253B05|nr:ComEC/Rec2 family competence protein [Rhizobium alarense]MCF3639070.1 ComEC family competence protein [Rhizobium alarense]
MRDQAELGQDRRAEIAGWSAGTVAPEAAVADSGVPVVRPAGGRLRLRCGQALATGRRRFGEAAAVERDFGHVLLFCPVALGTGAAVWYGFAADPPLAAPAVALAILAAPAMVSWRHRGWPGLIVAMLLLVPLGMLLAAFESRRMATVLLDMPVTTTVTGRILAREIDDRGRYRYLLAVGATREPVLKRPPERVRLLARGGKPLAIGATVTGRARLSPPSGPALAGLNDFAFDAYMAGIGAFGFFYGSPAETEGAGRHAAGPLEFVGETVGAAREAIGNHIRNRIGGEAGAIAAALVTGEERAIGEETIEVLRQAGLAHVLAISGLNMVLAAGTFLVGARTLLAVLPGVAERYPVKKIAAVGALLMVTGYILISGGAVSAVRAWIMISVMLVAVLFDRAAISLRNLALSAILILAVTPSAVTGPGFQMSYAATLGLVAGYARWRERAPAAEAGSTGRVLRPVLGFFAGLLLSSLIGGLATLIYSVGHFHRLPAYGLAGNMLAMPIISLLVMPAGMVALLLMPFGLDGPAFSVMGTGIDWMIRLSAWVAGWGGEVVTGRIPFTVFLLVGTGGALLCLLRTRLRLAGVLLLAAGASWFLLAPREPPPDLVVSEDGRLVAAVSDGRVATNRQRPSDFVFAQWSRALRLGDPVRPHLLAASEPLRDVAGETGGSGLERRIDGERVRRLMRTVLSGPRMRFTCHRREWCGARTASGLAVVTLDDPAFLGPACDTADIVVAAQPLRQTECRSGARLFTARSLRATGALEIRRAADDADEGSADQQQPVASVYSSAKGDRQGQQHPALAIHRAVATLERPWSRHRLYDWRTDKFSAAP